MDLEQVKHDIENKKAILIDVREQNEWDKSHLSSAKLVPLSSLDEGEIPSDLPNDKILYLYCQRGGRAKIASNILNEEGFNSIPLKDSFDELKLVLSCHSQIT